MRKTWSIRRNISICYSKTWLTAFWHAWRLGKSLAKLLPPCEKYSLFLHFTNTLDLTFCSFHRIEQNICLVGTSINKGCAVYYYSVVMHGLRIIRYLWTKCREKSVLRRLHRREKHTKFCIDSSKRSCRVDFHVVIAMWYTALFKITASFRQTKNGQSDHCRIPQDTTGYHRIPKML